MNNSTTNNSDNSISRFEYQLMVRYEPTGNFEKFEIAMKAIFNCLLFYRLEKSEHPAIVETSSILFNNKIAFV